MTVCDVVFLCTERELTRERAGMWEALQPLATVRVLPAPLASAGEILEWWRAQVPRGAMPTLLWPDPYGGYLPRDLARCDALTACWHIDSFSVPEQRAEHARLFDVTFVFHPGSVGRFSALGVPEVHLLAHAVRGRFFPAQPSPRSLDVGFVGALAAGYSYRRDCLAALEADGCSVNDYRRHYDYAELAATYRSARIGLNVPQDAYLRDANLRCFEVMAAGAVLVTPAGSELRELGFVPGVHYVEFPDLEALRGIVRRLLRSESERAALAGAGQGKVLAEFTYDRAAATMLGVLGTHAADRERRARRLSPAEENRAYLRHLARCGEARAASGYFRRLLTAGEATAGDARDIALGLARALRARVRR